MAFRKPYLVVAIVGILGVSAAAWWVQNSSNTNSDTSSNSKTTMPTSDKTGKPSNSGAGGPGGVGATVAGATAGVGAPAPDLGLAHLPGHGV